jgi:predicted dithiol-disulfide oxidoreductase (DUF899 family)
MSTGHRIVPHDDWVEARRALLAREKEFTRARDALSQARRELPWEAVTKEYVFDGPLGRQTLAELFDGRSQLIVYHFMFGPDWTAGCPHCSFWADNFNGIVAHLNQRDTTLIAVSRAPYEKLASYRRRMGWSFTWVSAAGSDFNFDNHVSFTPAELAEKRAECNYAQQDPRIAEHAGTSVFYREADGRLYHTYSTYARGLDMQNLAYHYLDLTPRGRDEGDRGPYWVRRRDEYGR